MINLFLIIYLTAISMISSMSMNNLPKDINRQLIDYLDNNSALNFSKVSRNIAADIQIPTLWKIVNDYYIKTLGSKEWKKLGFMADDHNSKQLKTAINLLNNYSNLHQNSSPTFFDKLKRFLWGSNDKPLLKNYSNLMKDIDIEDPHIKLHIRSIPLIICMKVGSEEFEDIFVNNRKIVLDFISITKGEEESLKTFDQWTDFLEGLLSSLEVWNSFYGNPKFQIQDIVIIFSEYIMAWRELLYLNYSDSPEELNLALIAILKYYLNRMNFDKESFRNDLKDLVKRKIQFLELTILDYPNLLGIEEMNQKVDKILDLM